MSSQPFSRARSDEQRASRAALILATADAMLREMRVADITLNELSRRVGLAKSNVLRYFPSREAVLLQLLDRETRAWLDDVEGRLDEDLAQSIAAAAVARPVFCDLTASAAGVLERNVSGSVAAEYKRAAIANAERLAGLIAARLGPTSPAAGITLVGALNMCVGGIWSATQPSPGMAAAYREHPELRSLRHDFRIALREYVATLLTGLAHREPVVPFAADVER